MQFCKDCGTVLNLFGNNERELCSSCIQHKKKAEPSPAPAPTTGKSATKAESFELLADAVLSYENNKIVLRSKEGWDLWSGTPGVQIDLKTILARAGRIYEIRLRRQKN
ncbi:MAG: hypothetical protein GY799_19345 [Desulfobulbaceae bacterium]|nr:hypothetical protein [Desulfobulbaceae bacterium]